MTYGSRVSAGEIDGDCATNRLAIENLEGEVEKCGLESKELTIGVWERIGSFVT